MPVAAWYPDPADPGRFRWWDGTAWTEHLRDPVAEPAPVAETAPVAEPVEAPGPPTRVAYVPMQATPVPLRRDTGPEVTLKPGGSSTIAIAILAILPLVEAFGPGLVPQLDQLVVRAVAAGVVIAASVAFAAWDRRALDSHGYSRSSLPQPAFALLPVLYLVMRVFKVGGLSIVFLLLWAGIQAGAYATEASDVLGSAGGSLPFGSAAPTASGFALDPPYSPAARAYLLTPAGMAAKVAHDLNVTAPVTCAPLPSTTIGATTTCDVELPAGAGVRETIELQDDTAVEPFFIESTAPLPAN